MLTVPLLEVPSDGPASPRRWALELASDYVGVIEQLELNGRWVGLSARYALLAWTPKSWTRWGRVHSYYDGPNDGLLLGPLQLWWSLGWCAKCAMEVE